MDFKQVESKIDKLAELIRNLSPEEVLDIGTMLIILNELIDSAKELEPDTFLKVAEACRNYVETTTLDDTYNTKPIYEGINLLRALLRHHKKGSEFMFDTSNTIEILNMSFSNWGEGKSAPDEGNEPASVAVKAFTPVPAKEPEKITDEDVEILIDFITESEENLESIEVNLIELERDPADMDIINNIFRPFHTIKGVSGFLDLKKINILSHATENLLDSARSGEFLINKVATDAILESVDTLKKLIGRVKQGVAFGVKKEDDDIDIDFLKEKLDVLKESLVNEEDKKIGEILVEKGVIDKNGLEKTLKKQKKTPGKKIGEMLVESKEIEPKEVKSALKDQRKMKTKITSNVKVSTEKLDNLVDFAGELVIAQSILKQRASKDPELHQSVVQLGQIVTNMQTIAMSMRMIPIKATFMKMIRLVRDLSNRSNKKISLEMTGKDTEIDRNVVDALYEPMVHMIRNSVDHGIEQARDRKLVDKPPHGTINLKAYHKGGNIMIEIEDDGKGLDKDKIFEKAVSTGLVSKDANLTDAQIYDLILHPGFSTAKEITDISGRGVGMDVVKDGLEKFRGHLSIASTKGKGTIFTISLPLTLAIIDGMLVKIGKDRYVIPTTAIQRVFKPNKEDTFTVEGKGEMVQERNGLIPIIRLKKIYQSQNGTKPTPAWESLVVVVESKDEKRGLLIDELLGKDEFVIKSLGQGLEEIDGFAGGAILGDGKVGLILDVYGIFKMASTAA